MLTLRDIDAGYGTFQALFGVSLEVNAGEAIGVIGPNGAGKTTLMRVISGLIRPTAGRIDMEGADLLTTPAAPHPGTRHRACARKPPPVRAHDGRGQSAHGRLHPGRAREIPPAARIRLRSVSAAERTPRAIRRHHVGRRTADVRHRPRVDVGASAFAAGRTVRRSRARSWCNRCSDWSNAFAPAG